MGTSKSYPGPMDRNPLLPPGAPPPLEDGGNDSLDQADDERPTWASVKAAMTRLAKSGNRGAAARPAIGKIASRFVRAQGGARSAARSAAAGRRSALNLGSFLARVSQSGIASALRTWNLTASLGEPVEFLFDQLLDALAPAGESIEEEIARVAMSKTLDEVFENAEEAGGIETLDQLSEREVVGVMEIYLAHYINTRLMQALSDRNEAKSLIAGDAASIEQDIKRYVRELVVLDMREIDTMPGAVLGTDWAGHEGRAFIDRIFVDAFRLIEDGE